MAALDLDGRAFTLDSNFAQAAFGLVITNPLVGTVVTTAGFRAIPALWRLRDRLSPRDLALLRGMTFVGPQPSPSVHLRRDPGAGGGRRGGDAPDSPEHWFVLGVGLDNYGAVASVPDWPRRAADALDRAIALDSTFTPALRQRLYLAVLVRDREAIERLVHLLDSGANAGAGEYSVLWAAAAAMGDSAGALRWRSRFPAASMVLIALVSAQDALPLADARWANATLRREGATVQERGTAQLGEYAVALAEGRVVDSWDGFMGSRSPWDEAGLVRQAVVEPQYRPQALARLGEMNSTDWPPLRDCFGEMLRVTSGDTSGTRRAIQRLRAFAALDPPPIPRDQWEPLEFRVCPLLLEAMLEGGRDPGAAPSRLEALDSLMRGGPRWLTLRAANRPRRRGQLDNRAASRGAGQHSGGPCGHPAQGKQLVSCLPLDPARVPAAGGPARGPDWRDCRGAVGVRSVPHAPDRPRSGLCAPARFRDRRARGARAAVSDVMSHESEYQRV